MFKKQGAGDVSGDIIDVKKEKEKEEKEKEESKDKKEDK